MKILVLEDDLVSLKSLEIDLKKMGIVPILTSNFDSAVDEYSSELPRIVGVITDIEIPEKNGVDFIREVRKLSPKLPIVVISGTLKPEILKTVKKYGCLDVLVKPYDRRRLTGIVATLKLKALARR